MKASLEASKEVSVQVRVSGMVLRAAAFGASLGFIVLAGCSSSALKYDKSAQLSKNAEFDNAVKIEHTEPDLSEDDTGTPPAPTPSAKATPAPAATPNPAEIHKPIHVVRGKTAKKKTVAVENAAPATPAPTGKKSKKKSSKKSADVAALAPTASPTPEQPSTPEQPPAPAKREPDLEDDAGFAGRRPVKDPFRIGEVVTHDVHYFKVSAGTLKLKVDPMVVVNGRKAYNFVTEVKSSSVFSSFYSVEDRVENFVDFETLVPRVFSLHVKETSQLREARMIFDEKTLKATYWEKKVTEKNGEEEKKQSWEILPYSQNVFSAAFYMRNFDWDVGKEISFRVADDEQNLVFKGKCLRKETLDTALGPMKAVVIQPQVTLKGAFKPVGDIYIWLSDDDRKYILRIESKIKIGTIISEIIALKPGRN